MIEKTILDYLTEVLGVDVYTEKPRTPASRTYVLIERTGRRKQDHIYETTIAFQSYAETMFDAAALNELVEAAVETLPGLDDISAVSLNTSYNFTDSQTKEYRYQCVYDITHY